MIPVEVRQLSTRRLLFQQQQNEENTRVKLETIEEVHEMEKISEEATKLRVARRYNTNVQPRRLQEDWVRDAGEGPMVLMSLRVEFGPMG